MCNMDTKLFKMTFLLFLESQYDSISFNKKEGDNDSYI